MKGILPDLNIQGHLQWLAVRLRSEAWSEFWAAVDLDILTFEQLGLAENASDRDIWRTCQREQLILITANRNAEGPTSLEVTLREENTPESLPVLTLASPERIRNDPEYAERVVIRMLETLMDIDLVRGTGRIFIP
jgi:hypothetical protein